MLCAVSKQVETELNANNKTEYKNLYLLFYCMLHTTRAAKVAKTQHQDSAIDQSIKIQYLILCLLLI